MTLATSFSEGSSARRWAMGQARPKMVRPRRSRGAANSSSMSAKFDDRAGMREQAAARNCGEIVILRLAGGSLVLACAGPVLAVFFGEDYMFPKPSAEFFGASTREKRWFVERESSG